MRKLITSITLLVGLSLAFTSCDDDKDNNPNTPNENKVYFNTESNFYVYNSYDLNDNDNRDESTEYQDSVVWQGTEQKNGREAYRMQYYTNQEGSYEAGSTRYYASEENKLYLHSEFLTSGFTEIEGIDLNDIFDVPAQWMLIADAENSGSWQILTNDFTTTISGIPTTGNLTISSRRNGSEDVQVINRNYSADKYILTLDVDATAFGQNINFSVDIEMLLVDGIGIVKEKQANVSVNLQIQEIQIDGYESTLINYQREFGSN